MSSDYNADRVRHRYQGKSASMYEEVRGVGSKGEKKWLIENAAVDKLLSECHGGSHVVDIPVGTGRYAESYAKYQMMVTGMDTSQDMLDIASKACRDRGIAAGFLIHDILDPLPTAETYDIAVCTRLVNHFTLAEAQLAVKNLLNAAHVVILGLREPNEPTDRNWHLLTDLLPKGARELSRVTMSDKPSSRYIMAKISSHVD